VWKKEGGLYVPGAGEEWDVWGSVVNEIRIYPPKSEQVVSPRAEVRSDLSEDQQKRIQEAMDRISALESYLLPLKISLQLETRNKEEVFVQDSSQVIAVLRNFRDILSQVSQGTKKGDEIPLLEWSDYLGALREAIRNQGEEQELLQLSMVASNSVEELVKVLQGDNAKFLKPPLALLRRIRLKANEIKRVLKWTQEKFQREEIEFRPDVDLRESGIVPIFSDQLDQPIAGLKDSLNLMLQEWVSVLSLAITADIREGHIEQMIKPIALKLRKDIDLFFDRILRPGADSPLGFVPYESWLKHFGGDSGMLPPLRSALDAILEDIAIGKHFQEVNSEDVSLFEEASEKLAQIDEVWDKRNLLLETGIDLGRISNFLLYYADMGIVTRSIAQSFLNQGALQNLVTYFEKKIKETGPDSYGILEGVKTNVQESITLLQTVANKAARAEVRKIEGTTSTRLERRETTNRFQEKYAVVVDMKVFDALLPEQRKEFYKLMAHYREGDRVRFIFPVVGDRQMDTVWEELSDRKAQFGNVEIPINPIGFGFQGRKVINVSKEGIQSPYADFLERRLSQSKDLYRVRYREADKEAGLLTAALLLLESKPSDFIRQGRYFSEVPLGLEAEIEHFLLSYVYVGRSA